MKKYIKRFEMDEKGASFYFSDGSVIKHAGICPYVEIERQDDACFIVTAFEVVDIDGNIKLTGD